MMEIIVVFEVIDKRGFVCCFPSEVTALVSETLQGKPRPRIHYAANIAVGVSADRRVETNGLINFICSPETESCLCSADWIRSPRLSVRAAPAPVASGTNAPRQLGKDEAQLHRSVWQSRFKVSCQSSRGGRGCLCFLLETGGQGVLLECCCLMLHLPEAAC